MPFPHIKPLLNSIDTIISDLDSRDDILQKISDLLSEKVEHYDWVGFYIVDDSGENLILGPYVGEATDHVKIAFGKGVCGQVADSQTSLIIQDISLEDNYLSCSSDVQAEVVFPIIKDDKIVAELDIDSHAIAPFTELDTQLLEGICEKLAKLF